MAITTIAIPPVSTIEGPPPNFDKITQFGTGWAKATNTPGGVGQYFTKDLRIASVGNSATAVVEDSFISDGKMRIVNVENGAVAVTATATFIVYNATQAVNILGTTTPSTTAAISTTITTPIVENNDIVQLIVTTNGSGALTNLVVRLTCQYMVAPQNAQAATT